MKKVGTKKFNYKPSFVLAGTVRNVESNIYQEVYFFQKILSSIGLCRILLIESDSNDGTVLVLKKLTEELSNFQFISFGNLSAKIPNRIERLNFCRNQYLKKIKSDKNLRNSDFICIADFDEMNQKLSSEKIKNVLNYKFKWDGIFANQLKNYYDILALRHPYWSPNNAWDEFAWYSKYTNVKNTKQRSVYNRMVRLKRDVGPIQVESAFGGFAIYKSGTLLKYNYTRTASNEPGDIDHVIINKKIVNGGGKLFIDPKLINAKWNIHSFSSSYLNRSFRLIVLKRNLFFLRGFFKSMRNLVLTILNNF